MMDPKFTLALARLDAEIAEAEARLKDLRFRREGAEAFLTYMDAVNDFTEQPAEPVAYPSPSTPSSLPADHIRPARETPKDVVMRIFERVPGSVLDIDAIYSEALREGSTLDRQQIRNGIHYAVRKGLLAKASKRGSWVLGNASAPGATGAEETEKSGNGFSLEEGGPDEYSGPLRDRHDHADQPHEGGDHVGHRASIEEVQ